MTVVERIIGVFRAGGRSGQDSNPLAGAIWVIFGMACLSGLVTLGRYLALAGMDPSQVMFFRNLFCVLLMLPMLAVRGPSLFQTRHIKLYGARVCLSFISMMGMFHAIALIPIGDVTAIGFLAPLLGTVFAVLLLGEVIHTRRVVALVFGFVGAMVVLRPFSMGLELGDVALGGLGVGQTAALVSATALGLIGPLVKKMTLNDDADRIVFLTNALLLPLSLVPAVFVWQWPDMNLWPYLVGLGGCALLGHMCLVRGYASSDATSVMTFKFVRLPFTVLLGYLVFSEVMDAWTWIGASIIFMASAYVTHREARIASKRRADGG